MTEPVAKKPEPHAARVAERTPTLSSVAIIGFFTCLVIYAIDQAVLRLARFNQWEGFAIYLVFGVFIVQTAMLGTFVGLKVKKQPIWWLFFGWMLVLINLILALVVFNSHSISQGFQIAFVYAFLTAQTGLVIFWSVLGSTDWRRRIPIGVALLAVCCYPYLLLGGGWFSWLSVMTCYIVSITAACVVLRLSKFRLRTTDSWEAKSKSGRIDQFGTKHLFIWTTIVAVLFGIGRLVPWMFLASDFLNQRTPSLVARAVLMTMIVVFTAWTVLGGMRGAWIRVLVLVGVLIGVGLGLVYIEMSSTRSRLVGWRLNADDLLPIWLIWTTLNGLFLAGLMLVLRCSGWQLSRFKKAESAE